MIYGALITEAQSQELTGQKWQDDCYFNPFKVGDDWYISEAEVFGCVNPELVWVRRLPLVEIEIEQEQPKED